MPNLLMRFVFIFIMMCSALLSTVGVSASDSSHAISIQPAHVVVGSALRYHIDPHHTQSIQDILHHNTFQHWPKTQQTVSNFGFDLRSYWFFFELKNDHPQELNRILELSYPMLDHVDFYVVQHNGHIRHIQTGDSLPMQSRPIHHRHFLVPLELESQETLKIFIQVKTTGALQMPLDVWNANAFFKHDQTTLAIQLTMLGILIGLGIYNLFLFFATKEPSYIWYVMTIFSMSFMIVSLYGLSAQFMWHALPELNNMMLIVAIGSSLSFSSMFAYVFLRVNRLHAPVRYVCLFFIFSSVFVVLLDLFVPYSTLIRLSTLASVVEAIGAMGLGLYLWMQGNPQAKFYTVAWGAFLLSTIILVLSKWGFLPSNIWTENALQVGYVAEGFLLSFALAYRMNIERAQRDQARQDILDMQREANELLELKVQERTIELEHLNRSLREISTHDGLTGVYNRIFFEEKMRSEWHRGTRAADPICLLMIDGDYFKKINDQYGHLCGDECLKHIAQQCEKTVNRAGDFVARYGGEEFVVLLSSTSLTGASLIAEKIRRAIQHHPFIWNDRVIELSVSIGVSSILPMPYTDAKTLISQADQACYAAKAAGRNAVYVFRHDNQTMIALHDLLKDRALPEDVQHIDIFLS